MQKYIFDEADKSTLFKAVLTEYFCMTLFLFFTIGTISSNCHAGDVASASGASSKALEGSKHAHHPVTVPCQDAGVALALLCYMRVVLICRHISM